MFYTKKFAAIVVLSVALSAPAASANEPVTPGAEEARGLLGCSVSLDVARDNLLARGYAIEVGDASSVSTAYRMSERDSTRRLLGGLAVERARGYRVSASGADSVQFVPRYRETVFATGVLGNRNDTVREFDVPLTTAMLETLKDMRREVCEPVARPSVAEGVVVNNDIDQYLRDRCKADDDRACRLLRAR